jgi:hypothetical protein
MSQIRQRIQHALRLLMGAAALYALLLQILLAALAGAPPGLDVASTLCLTDHNSTQQELPTTPAGHNCICAGICHAGFVAPPLLGLRATRVALSLAYDELHRESITASAQRAFSARGPPLLV